MADTTTTTVDTSVADVKKNEPASTAAAAEPEEEEKEFDDWEDAIEDVAEAVATKAKVENVPVAMADNEEFSDEEEKKEDPEDLKSAAA